MDLTINGQSKTIEAANIAQLLAAELDEGHSGRGIAVAVNGQVVPRTQWESARIHSGDRVEIVRALPGG
jgi:sulfur carrier protein